MNHLSLQFSRIMRFVSKDKYVPTKCNALRYKVRKKEVCDCKIWCKYPPGGTPVPITILNSDMYKNSLKQ